MSRSRASLLYLQMGQEVIYIVLACAIITSLLLLSIAVRTQTRVAALKQERDELTILLTSLKNGEPDLIAQVKKYVKEIEHLNASLSELKSEKKKLLEEISQLQNSTYTNDQPPIILLTESEGYTFETRSAKVSLDFRENVKNKIVPKLISNAERYSAHIIEVVGHTDEVPFGSSPKRVPTNLDMNLFKALSGGAPADALIPCDNLGLGMARAISVRQVLLELGLGANFVILPLSAGPAITQDEAIALGFSPHTGIEARRRIEIRLRRKSNREDHGQPN